MKLIEEDVISVNKQVWVQIKYDQVRDEVRGQVWYTVRDHVWGRVWTQVWTQFWTHAINQHRPLILYQLR
jgi:hypothetical protein